VETLEGPDQLSPDPDALAHLQALVDRLGLTVASRLAPRTVSEAHRAVTGHPLRFGCCRDARAAEKPS
jgi:hypothetical protein